MRDAEAKKYIEVMIGSSRSEEDVRIHLERQLTDVRAQIDAADRFDPTLQEKYEFLKAQEHALLAAPATKMVDRIPVEKPSVISKPPVPKPTPVPSLFDRVRSGWNAFKNWLALEPDLEPVTSGTTLYEQTWTDPRKAQREVDRGREIAAVQENAMKALTAKLAVAQERLAAVNAILTKRRLVPLPSAARTKYTLEAHELTARINETEKLLRIADAKRSHRYSSEKEAA
jgi:hypothetical protein